MTDVVRDKYARLMQEVADLEDRIEAAELDLKAHSEETRCSACGRREQELAKLCTQLEEKRHELSRVSSGCGSGHGS